MIIIEGPDGAGKSTLARAMSEHLNVGLHHSGGPAITAEEIFRRMQNTIDEMAAGRVIIYDRIPLISDQCYGPVLRGETPFHEDCGDPAITFGEYYTERLLKVMKFPIIYCRPNISVIVTNCHRDQTDKEARTHTQPKSAEHMRNVRSRIVSIVQAYDRLMGQFPHWTYDYTGGDGVQPTMEELVCWIQTNHQLTLV